MDVKVTCLCEPNRDHQDTITFRAMLDFEGAMACRQAVRLLKQQDPESSSGDFLAVISVHYLVHGIESWTLVDGREPVPVTGKAIRDRIFTNLDVAFELADVADELYTETVLLPLLGVAPNSSPPTPTDESTSPPTSTKPTSLRPSKRSSTTTSPTDDIGVTSGSHDGDSSFSQSSTSAA